MILNPESSKEEAQDAERSLMYACNIIPQFFLILFCRSLRKAAENAYAG
jgi:hypothetical protein